MSQLHFPTCHRVWEISLSHFSVSEMQQKLDNDKEFLAVKWKEMEVINPPNFPTITFVMESSDFVLLRKEQKMNPFSFRGGFIQTNTRREVMSGILTHYLVFKTLHLKVSYKLSKLVIIPKCILSRTLNSVRIILINFIVLNFNLLYNKF